MPVKQSYEDEFLIGTAISSEDLAGIRFDLLTTHFNSVTAGNAMKPGELQRTKGNFTFSGADNLVDTSLDAGMKVHGHTLVWHQQSPEWMNTAIDTDGNMRYLSREEALDNMRTHIKTVVEHFADKVISWDVVNEAMSDNSTNPLIGRHRCVNPHGIILSEKIILSRLSLLQEKCLMSIPIGI